MYIDRLVVVKRGMVLRIRQLLDNTEAVLRALSTAVVGDAALRAASVASLTGYIVVFLRCISRQETRRFCLARIRLKAVAQLRGARWELLVLCAELIDHFLGPRDRCVGHRRGLAWSDSA